MDFCMATFSATFNFLASLINGNAFANSSALSQDLSFNFLASLINGNLLGSSAQAPRDASRLLTS